MSVREPNFWTTVATTPDATLRFDNYETQLLAHLLFQLYSDITGTSCREVHDTVESLNEVLSRGITMEVQP